MVRKQLWRVLSLALTAALILSSLPLLVGAQSEAVDSTSVEGELVEQFSKHYLEIRPIDPAQNMQIVMEFEPRDNQELQKNSGFVVFTQSQFEAATRVGGNLTRPSLAKIAVGGTTIEASTGLPLKTATVGTETYVLVVINDSTVPLNYTLRGENVRFRDGSGEQVTDATAPAAGPATDDSGEDAATDETTTEETDVEETPADETAADVADTEDTAVEEEADSAEAETTTTDTSGPRVIRVSSLEGELAERDAQHFYALEVQNTGNPVDFTFSYDPQDSDTLDRGLNVYVLTDDQFRAWTGGGGSLGSLNTMVPTLDPAIPGKAKTGRISQPIGSYVVIAHNSTDLGATYELSVENAVLIDDARQSITAQEVSSSSVGADTDATTTAETEEAETTTTTAATTEGDGTIEIGSTYTVQSGDTLGAIARRAYGDVDLYRGLCAYNNIADCNVIEVGDQIEIPAQSELGDVDTAAETTTSTEAETTTETEEPEPTPTPTPEAAESDEEMEDEDAAAEDTTEAEETPEPAEEETEAAPTATPTEEAPTATPEAEESEAEASSGTIVQTAATFNVLDTLGLLLDLLELEQDQTNNIKAVLNSEGPFTFFAPTDSAFTALPEETLEALIAEPSELAAVLNYHIVAGTLTTSDLSDGMAIETLNGAMLEVSVGSDGTVTVDGATVTNADVVASNGVIHIVDSVLVPPAQ